MIEHGSVNGYFKDGCRCDKCRAAGAKYRKDYRAGRRISKEKPPSPIEHGTSNGYNKHGCRCDLCRARVAQYARDARARRGAKSRVPGPIGCAVEGCERPHMAKGLCRMHYYRVRTNGEPGSLNPGRAARGEGCLTPEGYRIISGVLEHRSVMEASLGRRLLSQETVHHKNGDRADNRPENLELWSSSQPAGQRVEDKVVWAREILTLYGDFDPLAGR